MQAGPNILALHGVNTDSNSSDLLVQAALIGDPEINPLVSLNPEATYLFNNGGTDQPQPVLLSTFGASPGDFIRLQRVGDYRSGFFGGDNSTGLAGVFSAGATVLGSQIRNRLPGAIDAGEDIITPNTGGGGGGNPTDIPEDFAIDDLFIQVPDGATHLFFTPLDTNIGNNTDPDGDWGVMITRFDGTPPQRSDLVARDAEWRYMDDGSNQGALWRSPIFDDSSWSSGAAQLGYGDGDEETVVNCGPTSPACNEGNFATTYFRHTFEIDDVSLLTEPEITLLRDDAGSGVSQWH